MPSYRTPGVYREAWREEPVRERELRTGVPGFLGFFKTNTGQAQSTATEAFQRQEVVVLRSSMLRGVQTLRRHETLRIQPVDLPERFTRWAQVEATLAPFLTEGYTRHAVKGFFANGGQLCYVYMIELPHALSGDMLPELIIDGLTALAAIDDVDLICIPDLMWFLASDESRLQVDDSTAAQILHMQAEVLKFCEQQGRTFALLDSLPGANAERVLQQRSALYGDNGALYYPWVKTPDGPVATQGYVPPCGHVAAIYAHSDARDGVHKAPANEVLTDVIDLQERIDSRTQAELNPVGINCIRSFPGRGLRVWGARTLSMTPFWRYVNVRRIFLTAARWIDQYMVNFLFEPQNPDLWARITRELNAYFTELWRKGALVGMRPEEAFFVNCNAETNPKAECDLGRVTTEIGLATSAPNEFIVVRIIQHTNGVLMRTPNQLAE